MQSRTWTCSWVTVVGVETGKEGSAVTEVRRVCAIKFAKGRFATGRQRSASRLVESDDVRHLSPVAISGESADDDVLLTGITIEKGLIGCQQDHVKSGTLLVGKRSKTRG